MSAVVVSVVIVSGVVKDIVVSGGNVLYMVRVPDAPVVFESKDDTVEYAVVVVVAGVFGGDEEFSEAPLENMTDGVGIAEGVTGETVRVMATGESLRESLMPLFESDVSSGTLVGKSVILVVSGFGWLGSRGLVAVWL